MYIGNIYIPKEGRQEKSLTLKTSRKRTVGSFVLANGETIKITQTPGKSGVTFVNTMGPAAIKHFQVGPGDAVLTATDGSGNSSSVTCLVPPPPK